MLGLLFTTDAHPRSEKGQPAQKTTGVASTSPIQLIHAPRAIATRPPDAMSAIVTTTTGAARTAASRSRRVMSAISGFGASVAVTVSGSSAIPQSGHGPGWSRTTSGCIGQVYWVPGYVADAACAGFEPA